MTTQNVETFIEQLQPGYWQADLIVDGWPMAGGSGFCTRDDAVEFLWDAMQEFAPGVDRSVLSQSA